MIPATTYVVFESVGKIPEAIQDVWKRAFSEWFPTSNYDIAGGAQIEWYSDGDGNAADYRAEVCVDPCEKKELIRPVLIPPPPRKRLPLSATNG